MSYQKIYRGEFSTYGPLWEANKRFMQACSEFAVAMAITLEPTEVQWPLRKFSHLFLNAQGLNYLEEAALHENLRIRSLELYEKYGKA